MKITGRERRRRLQRFSAAGATDCETVRRARPSAMPAKGRDAHCLFRPLAALPGSETIYSVEAGLCSIRSAASNSAGAVLDGTCGTGDSSSVAFLKFLIPFPRDFPMSGSFPGPKTTATTARMTANSGRLNMLSPSAIRLRTECARSIKASSLALTDEANRKLSTPACLPCSL